MISSTRFFCFFAMLGVFAFTVLVSAPAEARTNENNPAKTYIGPIAQKCSGSWEAQDCLKVLSQSTLVLASNYGADLKEQGNENAAENLKQHCAAATAATRMEVPADAMRSAMTECANIIFDISQKTGVKPDQSHYQLLVYPVMCLSGDANCPAVEKGLAEYR